MNMLATTEQPEGTIPASYYLNNNEKSLKPENYGGRPRKFKCAQEVEDYVEKYFTYCAQYDKPLTMSGLAVALGIDRTTLINYGKKDEYFDTVKKFRNIVEAYAEERLFGKSQVAGTIFALKNNHGWVDKTESEVTMRTPVITDSVNAIEGDYEIIDDD